MNAFLFSFLTIILCTKFLCACDSPMNHRLREDEKPKVTTQKIALAQLDLQVEIHWLSEPSGNVQVENSLLIVLKDPQGKLINLPANYTFVFYATMPSMGHPLDTPGDFEQLGKGIYLNKQIRYNMDGDWKNELWILDENLQLVDKIVWTEVL